MATIEIHMKPQGPVLEAFMASMARVAAIMGPLGSGKTYQSCQKLFTLMCQQKPNPENLRKTRWCAIRNTYPDLTTTTIKDWRELFGELGRYKAGGIEPPTHYLDFDLPDGSRVMAEVIFLAMDREDHVKKLRGMQVTGFWAQRDEGAAQVRRRYGRPAPRAVTLLGHGWRSQLARHDRRYQRAGMKTTGITNWPKRERPEGWAFFPAARRRHCLRGRGGRSL